MNNLQESAEILRNSIRDGTFPDSDELLTAELSTNNIPTISASIANARKDLADEIAIESKDEAGEIDVWIQQARKVQKDIARCKLEAKQIVQDHERLEAWNSSVRDAAAKARLLETEIDFTEVLRKDLQDIVSIYQSCQDIDRLLQNEQTFKASEEISVLHNRVSKLNESTSKALCVDLQRDLTSKTRRRLESALNTRVITGEETDKIWLRIGDGNSTDEQMKDVVNGFRQLGFVQELIEAVSERIERFMVLALRKQSSKHIASHVDEANSLVVYLRTQESTGEAVTSFARDFFHYLHKTLPSSIQSDVANQIIPKLVSIIIADWLNKAIPTDISQLSFLNELQRQASDLADSIKSFGWQGYQALSAWTIEAPKIWLMRRKGNTLNAVRKALSTSHGTLQQVEREERQIISLDGSPKGNPASDDWNDNWDTENIDSANDKQAEADNDASGWGFDDDDDDKNGHNNNIHTESNVISDTAQEHTTSNDDDEGEAWGWDDDTASKQKETSPSRGGSNMVNGNKNTSKNGQEVILKEFYSITDVPERLIEIISIDIQDAQVAQQENHTNLKSIPAASGLLALPTLALAMFRAIAPTHYSSIPSLSNMNLYNDSSHIVRKLRDISLQSNLPVMEDDCKAMEKFARSAYAREMEIQRTILGDLLDGAQGFTSSTRFPYSQEIENAVNSTVDRVRTVYKEWEPILSTSALLQSVGALVAMIITKIINDIEEMEDISEPESHRLNEFCTWVNALEDLFISRPPGSSADDAESVPMTAVYVSNWLKFQYLANILESSLVDIKFLWTEGELSLEFSQGEVVDLIKALFADSPHRRSAISAIRGYRGSGG